MLAFTRRVGNEAPSNPGHTQVLSSQTVWGLASSPNTRSEFRCILKLLLILSSTIKIANVIGVDALRCVIDFARFVAPCTKLPRNTQARYPYSVTIPSCTTKETYITGLSAVTDLDVLCSKAMLYGMEVYYAATCQGFHEQPKSACDHSA